MDVTSKGREYLEIPNAVYGIRKYPPKNTIDTPKMLSGFATNSDARKSKVILLSVNWVQGDPFFKAYLSCKITLTCRKCVSWHPFPLDILFPVESMA